MKALWRRISENRLGTATLVVSLAYMLIGLPAQIHQIWVTQSVRDVSLLMFLLLATQCIFWVMYGVQRKDWVMWVTNSICLIFSLILLTEYFIFM